MNSRMEHDAHRVQSCKAFDRHVGNVFCCHLLNVAIMACQRDAWQQQRLHNSWKLSGRPFGQALHKHVLHIGLLTRNAQSNVQ